MIAALIIVMIVIVVYFQRKDSVREREIERSFEIGRFGGHYHPPTIASPRGNLKKFDLDYRDLEGITQIGRGSYGVVFKYYFFL